MTELNAIIGKPGNTSTAKVSGGSEGLGGSRVAMASGAGRIGGYNSGRWASGSTVFGRRQRGERKRSVQIPGHARLQKRDQLRVHEFIVVGDVEADHLGRLQASTELLPQFRPVGFLHDKDDVRPADEFVRQRRV